MNRLFDSTSPRSPHGRETCPRCAGPAERIARLALDRLISVVVPLRRYQCCSPTCGWQGTLRVTRGMARNERRSERRPYL